jgi:transposase-like protein
LSRYSQKLWIEAFPKDVVYLPFEQPNGKSRRANVGGKDTPMRRIHQDETTREQLSLDLDEIARQGAKKMLAQALRAEVDAYLKAAQGERDEHGRALVVRNGYHNERQVLCGAGVLEVRAPRINDRRVDETTGEPKRFRSAILPPYMRRSPKVTEVLPLAVPARALHRGLRAGSGGVLRDGGGIVAHEHNPPYREQWQEEREAFERRDLSGVDYVYAWVDGIHTKVRLGNDDRLCCLVVVGARLDGKKELVAIRDGYRESEESWAELLRDLKKRGMRAPALAVGDGALGFWAAVREVFPETCHQREWVHKTANVLDALPKSVHGRAKKALHEITEAKNKAEAKKAVKGFVKEFWVKWPKAVEKVTNDEEALLSYYDYPAEHWRHLRTTNPIESPFATVRARTEITKGPGAREAGVAMIYKLLEAAEGRWRRLNGYRLVPLVRAGARFVNGELVERSEEEKVAA